MSANQGDILNAFGVTAEELAHFDDITGYRAMREHAEAERAAVMAQIRAELEVLQAQVDAEVARLDGSP